MKKSGIVRLRFLALMMTLGLAAGNGLWGWGGKPHAVITRAALGALPQWELEIWKDLLPKIIEEYCLIPDYYLSRPDLAGYAILDDYQVTFTDYGYQVKQEFVIRDGHYHLPSNQRDNFRLNEYFLGRIVSSLKDKKIEDAAKFAGVLLHVIEDYSAPSHSVAGDNQFYLFMQFLPPPEKFRYARLHGPIESGSVAADIAGYRPRLLGSNPSEAAFHLHQAMNQNIIQARGKVIPIIQALYREDYRRAYELLSARSQAAHPYDDFVKRAESGGSANLDLEAAKAGEEAEGSVVVTVPIVEDPAEAAFTTVREGGGWRVVYLGGAPVFPYPEPDPAVGRR